MSLPIADRFWSHVKQLGPDDCWEWSISRTRKGYGNFFLNGKNTMAHRVAYELANGPLPVGALVCHRCDNPPCCNPRHLFAGTQVDNMKDCREKGRRATGTANGSYTKPERRRRGETHGRAKLTESDVLEIRKHPSADRELLRSLAQSYGVSISTIDWIIRRRSWRHI
jgi:hypothetical protein